MCLSLSGVVNSVAVNVRKVIIDTRSRISVANVLCYIYVGDYLLPLDHFVLIRSDTLTF